MSDDLLTTVKAWVPKARAWARGSVWDAAQVTAVEIACVACDHLDAIVAALEAERIENAHLREAFVTMERAANERETEVANAYDTIMNWEHTYRKDMDIALGERDRLQGLLVQSNTALEALRLRHAEAVERLEAWARSNDEERQAGKVPTFLNPHTVLLWMGEAKARLT
jgi:hypothetical protein